MTVIRYVLSRILFAGFAALVGAFFALPMLWLTLAPFNARGTLAVEIPRPFTLDNFQAVFANTFAVRALGNSLILAGGTMLVVTLAATLAAYALSRAEVPYYDLLTYGLILFSSVVTGTAAMVPIFLLANALGLVDTYVGVIMAFTGGLLPTAIFILRDFVEGLPRSYEESAMVCGASPWRMVWDVVMPLLRPGMMVVGIWAFVQVWGPSSSPSCCCAARSACPPPSPSTPSTPRRAPLSLPSPRPTRCSTPSRCWLSISSSTPVMGSGSSGGSSAEIRRDGSGRMGSAGL